MAVTDEWAAPKPVSDVDVTFGGCDGLMPPREFCEDELRAMPDGGRKWTDFQSRWFYHGLPEGTRVTLREGVDGDTAFRHLSAVQGSYAPKHEHKVAAVAYLASRWFEDIAYG